MLQFGASLTDDAYNVNYNYNMFIIQATGKLAKDNQQPTTIDYYEHS